MRLRHCRFSIPLLLLCCCSAQAADVKAAAAAKPKPGASQPASPKLAACTAQRIDAPSPAGFVVMRDCIETPELVLLPGGNFRMGDSLGNGLAYERPAHPVRIAPFALGRHEVTFAQWQACVDAGGCRSFVPSAEVKGADRPVVQVSWDEVQDYVAWLSARTRRSYRLPSEAEWEYAVRANKPDQFTWGNVGTEVCSNANAFDQSGHRAQPQWTWQEECEDGYATTAPVGSFPPNAWGFHDMLGNVWEWVQDCWHADYEGAPDSGSPWMEGGDCGKRVNRGGGWGNNPRALRVSSRDADPRDARSTGLGFRVAFTLPNNVAPSSAP